MITRYCVQITVITTVLLVFAQSGSAALWEDSAAIQEYSGSTSFGTSVPLSGSGALNGKVDYAVYGPGKYDGSVTFGADLYVYAYQVFNNQSSTVGIGYFSVGVPSNVQVSDAKYDSAMAWAVSGGITPSMPPIVLPENVLFFGSISPDKNSQTLLFASVCAPGWAKGIVAGGIEGGAIVDIPSPWLVPEPATVGLLLGGAFLAFRRRQKI